MKKTLISVENHTEYICAQTNKVYCDKNTIITASAKDLYSAKRVEIVYDIPQYFEYNGGAQARSEVPAYANPRIESANFRKEEIISKSSFENFQANNLINNFQQENKYIDNSKCCAKGHEDFTKILLNIVVMIHKTYGINDIEKLREIALAIGKIIKCSIK